MEVGRGRVGFLLSEFLFVGVKVLFCVGLMLVCLVLGIVE